MKKFGYLICATYFGLIFGCATVPKELVDARNAYAKASGGTAGQLAPDELRQAKSALDEAEQSFSSRPKSYRTRDLAYVAQRKAQLAEVEAAIAVTRKDTQKAQNEFQTTQGEILNKTKEELGKSKLRASQLQTDLAKLAAVKEESRGIVITLSGSVIFASNKSELLASAQSRLDQVADALLQNKDRHLIVEGHTDSQGATAHNLELSQRRAEAVRSYLISRGYSGELIEARGMGEDRPVADNKTVEGRANNRRVEIIVVPESKDKSE